MKQRARAAGFTLIEMVITITVLAIVAVMVAIFIRAPVQGYQDTVDRAEVTDQADLTLRRIARDLRLALPNSVRVSADGSMLEFLQTRTGGRYLSSDDAGVDPTKVLSFDAPGQLTFRAIAPLASFAQIQANKDYVVVYNLGPGMEPANAWALPTGACANAGSGTNAGNIAQITAFATPTDNGGVSDAVDVTLANNPFACQVAAQQSPAYRFHVVSGPIAFYCQARSDGTLDLWRAWNYPVNATMTAPPAGASSARLAGRLNTCAGLFNYATAANQRTGLVNIDLSLRGRTSTTGLVRLIDQVHIDNTP
jgi:MSHA biogenesis protein MshO